MRKRAWLPVLLLAVFTLSLSAAFKKEDVKVTVKNGVLRIEGERRQEKEEKAHVRA